MAVWLGRWHKTTAIPEAPRIEATKILAENRGAKLSCLMLPQSPSRADREQALFRPGVSEDTADRVTWLTQPMKIASGNFLRCRFASMTPGALVC
jgi:hypothetical protein